MGAMLFSGRIWKLDGGMTRACRGILASDRKEQPLTACDDRRKRDRTFSVKGITAKRSGLMRNICTEQVGVRKECSGYIPIYIKKTPPEEGVFLFW